MKALDLIWREEDVTLRSQEVFGYWIQNLKPQTGFYTLRKNRTDLGHYDTLEDAKYAAQNHANELVTSLLSNPIVDLLQLKCPECLDNFIYRLDSDDYVESVEGLEGDFNVTCPYCEFEEIKVHIDFIPTVSSKHKVPKKQNI